MVGVGFLMLHRCCSRSLILSWPMLFLGVAPQLVLGLAINCW
jgi:hypothetical protein